jgi:hypothetical protein
VLHGRSVDGSRADINGFYIDVGLERDYYVLYVEWSLRGDGGVEVLAEGLSSKNDPGLMAIGYRGLLGCCLARRDADALGLESCQCAALTAKRLGRTCDGTLPLRSVRTWPSRCA